MQKAISEVIIVVIILMISVAIIGVAYVFVAGLNSQTASEVGETNTQALKKLGSCLQIVAFDEDTSSLKLKNCGRYPIENVTVFIDNSPAGSVSISAKPNENRNIPISAPAGIHEIKLEGDYVSAMIAINVTGAVVIPLQINFFIKNDAGENVAQFGSQGNIYIRGNCVAGASCGSPPSDAPFIVQNPAGAAVSYIDSSGNLCLQDSNCNDNDANCNSPGEGSFIIQNDSSANAAYINSTGNLCLIGTLNQNIIL